MTQPELIVFKYRKLLTIRQRNPIKEMICGFIILYMICPPCSLLSDRIFKTCLCALILLVQRKLIELPMVMIPYMLAVVITVEYGSVDLGLHCEAWDCNVKTPISTVRCVLSMSSGFVRGELGLLL